MLMSDPKATGNTALCTELKYLRHTWGCIAALLDAGGARPASCSSTVHLNEPL